METSRRNIMRFGLWAIPAVSIASASPAFATSAVAKCAPKGFRFPGESHGKQRKHKYVLTDLGCPKGTEVRSVVIGEKAAKIIGGCWTVSMTNSRVWQIVTVLGKDNEELFHGRVDFPVVQRG